MIFEKLVKRGANITYCTASAGDLEALAKSNQSFDWSIVEESGKIHGFELALPLQAGHRWLLIGDHLQLPPYRIEDYLEGISRLGEAVTALENLDGVSWKIRDDAWIQKWKDSTPEEQELFKKRCERWVKTFEYIFTSCEVATGKKHRTEDEPNGSAAGMLSGQYRMHPDIAELVSEVYYDGKIESKTKNDITGEPIPTVVHPFVLPEQIVGKAVVWLDTPWVNSDPRCGEVGNDGSQAPYINLSEVAAIQEFLSSLAREDDRSSGVKRTPDLNLAILSPYFQQVSLINRQFNSMQSLLPPYLKLRTGLATRRRNRDRKRFAHTVDSFQGNEADIVLVSLVRNNLREPLKGMGFLNDKSRMNVTYSHARTFACSCGKLGIFFLPSIAD